MRMTFYVRTYKKYSLPRYARQHTCVVDIWHKPYNELHNTIRISAFVDGIQAMLTT